MRIQLDLLCQHGRLLEVSDFENEKREELELPLLQGKTEDIKTILERLGFHREEKTEG
jgi:hypothetical protein